VVAHPTQGPASIKDLIERSKAQPEGLSYGSTGTHTGQHITVELLKKATGANLTHIPYRGSAPAIVDLVAGQIPLAAVDITSAYPQILAGRARALGMGETKRSKAAPEIPTIAEGGVEGFGRAGGFIGLFAPGGTPPAIVRKISAEVAEILNTPAVQANARTLTVTTAYEDEVAFSNFLAAEAARWKVVLRDLFN
jgi:tripartite-type tricarboxylate transporter receptor subunit TctC